MWRDVCRECTSRAVLKDAVGMSGYGMMAVESARTGMAWVVMASAHVNDPHVNAQLAGGISMVFVPMC